MKLSKIGQAVLALVLATNTVYANGNIKVEVTRQEQAQNGWLRRDIKTYFYAVNRLSVEHMKQVQVTAIFNELNWAEDLKSQNEQELQDIQSMIAKAGKNEMESLIQRRTLAQQKTQPLLDKSALIQRQLYNFFYTNYYPHGVPAIAQSLSFAATQVAEARRFFNDAKLQVMRRVSPANQAALLNQLNQYEKSKNAWIKSQVLMRELDQVEVELDLLYNLDFKNPILVKKYGRINAGASNLEGWAAAGTLFALFAALCATAESNPRSVFYVSMTAVVAFAATWAYLAYDRKNSGPTSVEVRMLVDKKLQALREELSKANDDLKESTQDMELLIEGVK